ncbi:MAG: bifunctional phosphopantothenoylcysteine decarboxylase/phosphopantothenate--cysteine ligase CoaBC [Dehalococcoidia bacterium]|jgi:phosphopantothenoylcysteine decarboxylase/phosphopantothenate--cysteine ligase
MLSNKTVVLGITGSIAAYKAADIASRLTKEGAKVEVVMTKAATWFIAPLALRSITGRSVITDMFNAESERTLEHVTLAEAADVVVIAPATASLIAKLAAGIADEMPALVVLATRAPVILAPAMNVNMYQNAITQENLAKLKARGFTIIDPERGRLASGRVGLGRLADTDKIIGTITQVLGRKGDLAGKKLVVTAGGTQEPIDPVRHITNPSSGKMGYAIAEAARDRGAEVKLVTAPTSLPAPAGVEVISVRTTVEMQKAVAKAVKGADALVMAAAVTDYQPKTTAKDKLKKDAASLKLELVRTPDILAEVKGDFIRVGFAAESNDIIANAKKKLSSKKLDMIVANDITAADSGFGVDTNRVIIIDKKGKAEKLPLMSKREVADRILDGVVGLVKS